MKRAEAGDAVAMQHVAWFYETGEKAFIGKDMAKAFMWQERAHNAFDFHATAKVGELLLIGVGVPQDITRGAMLLGMAAAKGSDFAAFVLGKMLADGTFGFEVDLKEARRWLETSLSSDCPMKHMTSDCKKRAQEYLDRVASLLSQRG